MYDFVYFLYREHNYTIKVSSTRTGGPRPFKDELTDLALLLG